MKTIIALLAFVSFAALAAGPQLRDPTRPPDAMAADSDGEIGHFRLDMVMRPVKGKALAVINGQQLKLGEEIDGVKVVDIRDGSVTLRGADGKETVTLSPGVEKIMRTTRSDGARSKRLRGGGS